MKKFLFLIISVVNAAVMTLWIALSPVETVPIHYGAGGQADRFSTKWELMIMPCVILATAVIYTVFCVALRNSESYKKNEKYVFRSVGAIFVFILAMFWYLFISSISWRFELGSFSWAFFSMLIGALMIFLGNFFGKLKQNGFLGIKTYATLHSEAVWRKTHRLGGYLSVTGGFIVIIMGIAGAFFNQAAMGMFVASLVISLVLECLVPAIYAHILYNKEKNNNYNME